MWERSGRWATALRRELPSPLARQVVEIRSHDEARADLAASPASMLLIEAAGDRVDATVTFLATAKAEFPRLVIAVVGERSLAPWEWLLREAGAETLCLTIRRAGELARMAIRHLARTPPPQTDDLRTWLAARLPWPAAVAAPRDEPAGS